MDASFDNAPPHSIEKLLEHANTRTHEHEPKCCCGKPQCAFLAHNSAALEGLEQDLVSAAEIGQALLVRHESYMAEAEAQRLRMTDTIETLELEKIDLETTNARTIDENRRLLDQLEELNNQVATSDAQVQSLTVSLQSTQAELDRLTLLSQRTAALEDQLAALELEQSELQTTLVTTEEGKRSALQRWKRAENTISQLQEQIDRIEKEASEDRERHVQVLERMEKRRSVERELEAAAGRLKGAAALTSLGRHDAVAGGNVVSHFVKDILQDNSNLQNGILELRELLLGSNAEVETLREQLQLHRPLDDVEDSHENLNQELKMIEPVYEVAPSLASENGPSLHVHHHYHAPNITVRKTKKKKPTINTTRYASSLGTSTPVSSRPRDWYTGTAASISTILEHTSASVPPINHQHRLSAQSTHTMSSFAPSSVPSSPRRASSVFDSIDGTFDFSQPTTPESSICSSPMLLPRDVPLMKATQRSASGPVMTQATAKAIMPSSSISNEAARSRSFEPFASQLNGTDKTVSPFGGETIIEESEHTELNNSHNLKSESDEEPSHIEVLARPPIRRAASHESLISISGMDIHTLRSRPSQLLLNAGAFSPRSTMYSTAVASPQSSQAATSHAVALSMRPAYQPAGQTGSDLARSLLSSQVRTTEDRTSLTRKVGGWVWGKWGMAPASLNGAASPGSPPQIPVTTPKKQPERPFVRQPGVNQMGAIQGLLPPRRTPIQIETRDVNEDLLRESLVEGQMFGF